MNNGVPLNTRYPRTTGRLPSARNRVFLFPGLTHYPGNEEDTKQCTRLLSPLPGQQAKSTNPPECKWLDHCHYAITISIYGMHLCGHLTHKLSIKITHTTNSDAIVSFSIIKQFNFFLSDHPS